MAPPPPFEDAKLGAQALAYVIELYRELTVENGAPTLGTQNQVVDFIRADPELLSLSVADVPEVRWMQSPGDGQWSPAEVLEHLILTEASVSRR